MICLLRKLILIMKPHNELSCDYKMTIIKIIVPIKESYTDETHSFRNNPIENYILHKKTFNVDDIVIEIQNCDYDCKCKDGNNYSLENMIVDQLKTIKEIIKHDNNNIYDIQEILSNNVFIEIKSIMNDDEYNYDAKREKIEKLIHANDDVVTQYPFCQSFVENGDKYEVNMHVNEKYVGEHLYITMGTCDDHPGYNSCHSTKISTLPYRLSLTYPDQNTGAHGYFDKCIGFRRHGHNDFRFEKYHNYY